MVIESSDPTSPHWPEPKYPTDEEIAALPEYVSPATRWSLGIISFIAGCIASSTAIMRLIGGEVVEPPPNGPLIDVASQPTAWVGLISGMCWIMAGFTISRGRLTATAIWFLFGIVTGIVVTIM